MGKTYTVVSDTGSIFTSHSDPIDNRDEAIKTARRWAKAAQPGEKIYLQWHRDIDTQTGYINPDGSNDITGTPWN